MATQTASNCSVTSVANAGSTYTIVLVPQVTNPSPPPPTIAGSPLTLECSEKWADWFRDGIKDTAIKFDVVYDDSNNTASSVKEHR